MGLFVKECGDFSDGGGIGIMDYGGGDRLCILVKMWPTM